MSEAQDTTEAADGQSLLTDVLGVVYMTNSEVADAIATAWQMQHRTGRISANHGDITAHLAALLKIQQDRARLTPNAELTGRVTGPD